MKYLLFSDDDEQLEEIINTGDVMTKEFIGVTFTNLTAGTLYKAVAFATIKGETGEESQADVLLGKCNIETSTYERRS